MRVTFAVLVLFIAAPAGALAAPSALDRLVIKDACSELLLTYGEGLDKRDPLKIWPLFTEEGVWIADGDLKIEGREALRKLWEELAARPRPTVGRHAISNIRFDVLDKKTATGSALVTMYRYDPKKRDEIASLSPLMLVEIDMRCVRTGEGWRFERMALRSVFVAGYRHGEN
jgi:hypothetical protein